MDIKVCVYTVCKDEEQHVIDWYNTVKDANAIVVLDTGSTDSTWDKLMECGDNMYIDKFNYEGDFNFASAKDHSLKLAKDICNSIDADATWIFVTVDLDEFLCKYSIQQIKKQWRHGFDTMKLRCYDGTHHKDVEYKIHSNGNWMWQRNTLPTLSDKTQAEWITGDAQTGYTRIPNKSKSASYYQLLKDDLSEHPNDVVSLISAAEEAIIQEEWDNVLKYSEDAIDVITQDETSELYEDYRALIQCYFNCATYWNHYTDSTNEQLAYDAAIQVIENGDHHPFRKAYVLRGDCRRAMNDFFGAIEDYEKALQITETLYNYGSDNEYYTDSQIYNRLAVSYAHAGLYEEAKVCEDRAIEHCGEVSTYYENLDFINKKLTERMSPTITETNVNILMENYTTPDKYIELASMYEENERDSFALACYDAALLLDKYNVHALIGLTKLLMKRDNWSYIVELLEQRATTKELKQLLADAYYKTGNIVQGYELHQLLNK